MKTLISCLLAVALTGTVLAEEAIVLQTKSGEPGELDISLQKEVDAAIDRGLKWLLANQKADGHWSSPEFPALTALPLWALAQSDHKESDAVRKAKDFILSCVHDNGAIYVEPDEQRKGGGLSTYNTAICMIALHQLGDPELTPVILKAREFVANSQHLGGDIYSGGMGYDPSTGRPYADLSNTYIAYEAMRMTEDVEDQRKEGEKADLDWQEAQEFLGRIQNTPENKQSWVSDDPDERGGFIYRPDESKAGSETDEEGVVRFRTYGSMTYAGLLSLIYADVDRDDPRVRSAFDWAVNHWTLEENPGMGNEGLFYFYNVLSKGLAAYGRDVFTPKEGAPINWKAQLARKLLSLQKIDPDTGHGYWLNEQGRWWEADPVLVTSYSLVALQIAGN